MAKGIIFKNKIPNAAKWVARISSALGVLMKAHPGYHNNFILAFFLSSLIIALVGIKLEKKTFFPLIGIGVPWVLLIISFFGISFSEKHILFLIPLQVLTFGGLIFYYAGYLFEYLWHFRNGWLKQKWNSLDNQQRFKRFGEMKAALYVLPLSHFVLAYFSFADKDWAFMIEQFGIGLLFFILLLWVLLNGEMIGKQAKKIASLYFFILIIITVFDSILTEILYLGGNGSWSYIGSSTIIIFIGLTDFFLFPESKGLIATK